MFSLVTYHRYSPWHLISCFRKSFANLFVCPPLVPFCFLHLFSPSLFLARYGFLFRLVQISRRSLAAFCSFCSCIILRCNTWGCLYFLLSGIFLPPRRGASTRNHIRPRPQVTRNVRTSQVLPIGTVLSSVTLPKLPWPLPVRDEN